MLVTTLDNFSKALDTVMSSVEQAITQEEVWFKNLWESNANLYEFYPLVEQIRHRNRRDEHRTKVPRQFQLRQFRTMQQRSDTVVAEGGLHRLRALRARLPGDGHLRLSLIAS